MARVIRAPGTNYPTTATRVKHRGSFYVRQTRWGPVAQAWPRKRPNWKNPTNLAQRAEFTRMVRAQQSMMSEDIVGAMGLARGSLFMWRDILNRSLVGRFIDFDPVDYMTPQEILDAITDHVGAMLLRTEAGWIGLEPGADGQVATIDPTTHLPAWADAVSGINFTDSGPWDGAAGYDPGNVVQFMSTARLCWQAVPPATGGAQPFDQTNSQGTAITLSTTNTPDDTATNTGGGNGAIGGTDYQNTGQWYFEMTFTANSDNNTAITVSDNGRATCSMRGQALGNINGYGAGTGSGSWPGITVGNRLGCAVDFDAKLIWFCPDVTAGSLNWNNSTSNDPAAGSGGISIGTDFTAHPGAPMVEFQSTASDQAVIFTAPADLLIGTVPTGFAPWIGGVLNPDPDSDPDHWIG